MIPLVTKEYTYALEVLDICFGSRIRMLVTVGNAGFLQVSPEQLIFGTPIRGIPSRCGQEGFGTKAEGPC